MVFSTRVRNCSDSVSRLGPGGGRTVHSTYSDANVIQGQVVNERRPLLRWTGVRTKTRKSHCLPEHGKSRWNPPLLSRYYPYSWVLSRDQDPYHLTRRGKIYHHQRPYGNGVLWSRDPSEPVVSIKDSWGTWVPVNRTLHGSSWSGYWETGGTQSGTCFRSLGGEYPDISSLPGLLLGERRIRG